MRDVRITLAVATVLRVFVEEVGALRYGYELMQLTGYPSGKLYPILARLEAAGWLSTEMEQVDTSVEGRPPRRWYRLTEDGAVAARQALAALQQQITPRRIGSGYLSPAGGHA